MNSDPTLTNLSQDERRRLLRIALARDLERRGSDLPPIEPAAREGRLPLSFAQQRLWFLEQLGNLGSTYHVPTHLRLRGDLDRAALVRALDTMVARHEALRTAFAQVNGVPEQRIAPADIGFHLVEHDLGGRADAEAELGRWMAEEADAPFDLERGPLIRGRLIRLAADDHVLLLTMHHIVSDAWSMGVLTGELSALYAAFRAGEPDPLPPLPVQYADYAAWQRRWVDGEVLQAQADYWTRTLSGAPELLELPTDHPRPARQDFAGAAAGLVLGEELTAGLKALSERHGTTLFMTVLAGWATVLSRLSGQEDVVVGTPSANRGRRNIEGLIGFFLNTLALRVELSGAPTVAEVLARVKARALEAQANQDIPFEQVVELVQPARSLGHTPLFQVMLAWQNAPQGGMALPGLKLAPAGAASAHHVTAKFDLLLSLGEAGGRLMGGVEYATALFEKETVARWLGYLRRVLEGMAADDAVVIDRLPMLAEAERRLVLREFNDTRREYPREACVHELFEAQVARTPGAVAVVFEGERVTYAALNARANRLAHHLRALGVGADGRVGICVERSVEMVVGLLGILKAGGAYVPLDASYPVDRLRNMLEDSAPAVLLTHPPQAATAAALSAGSAIPVLDLTGDEAWAVQPATNPGREGLGPRNLAHVLFTSGSTGRPKGVMLEHGSLVNRLTWMQDRYGMEPGEALLQKTPFSFDVSFWEFFWPLMVGARLVMARPGGHRDPAYLVEVIRREGVTVAHFVPSMLPLFLEHPDAALCTGLLRVPVSGEAVSAALARQFHQRLPGVELTNQYGPTESGEVTEWACDPDAERVSIGRAIHNAAVYVLDRTGEPVPVGVAGELFIGGVAVARGYLGRPRLTAERFVPDPFGASGARMYRTGDLCRWLADGTLEYLGRTDFQVKVRGFRVELGEIEARLASHPGVREAVVLALDDGAGGKRLVAYFVGEALESEALRAHLSGQLPEYMVPAAFVRLERLPLTPNGKLDRRALPAPDADAFAARAYEAPLGETEQALAEIWFEVLRIERVGRHDDFFALGGHSLLAVRVISRVRQVLGAEVSLADLFERPVLAEFARAIDDAVRTELPPIERVDRGERLPLSFAQARLWFLEQLGGLGDTYHLPTQMRRRGELDRGALRRALDAILARHEALRTTFVEVEDEPVQRIAPVEESRFHLLEHDLDGHPDAAAELRRLAAEEAGAPFDLERGPLIRGRLVRLAEDDHVLLMTMHHIVSDGWSMEVLTRELGTLYDAFRRGGPDPLPPLPVQYADYAVWQRKWVDGEVLREQAEYWKTTLAGAPELLELPTDRPRPARQDFSGAFLPVALDEGVTAALEALSRRHGTTLHMTLLAAWSVVLSRLSGQGDVVVGTPSANRGRTEIEGLIGFFVNTLALRVDLSGSPSVAELLAQVRARSLGAQHHQDIPFEQVVELVQPARSMAHAPLFQVLFAWQNASEGRVELPGPGTGDVGPAGAASRVAAKFDLSLSLGEAGGRIGGSLTYATSLFERATVERHLAYLRRVLEAFAAGDLQAVDALPLLPETERRLVLEEWNRTEAEYPRGLCTHELFEAQVRRTPDAVALVHADEALTYADLNARANRLARRLAALGVAPEAIVALALERSVEMVVALLAVNKAGAAFLPVDPAYPAERRRWMLERSAASLILTTSVLAADLPVTRATVVALDEIAAEIEDEDDGDLSVDVDVENAAYVIFTSGSTGRPKGVVVPHRGIGNLAAAQREAFGVEPDGRVLQFASFSFDAAVAEVAHTLLGGATLVMARPGQAGPDLLALMRDRAVTVATLPPSLLATLPADGLPALRTVVSAGEAVSADVVARWGAGRRFVNAYGPTETTVCATVSIDPSADGRPPIGRPIANVRAYVLDARMQPVPVGVPGELYVGGVGVVRGYLGQPGQTVERFVPDPFGGEPGARLYRTGDLGRWRPDGTLEFLGRTDFQVKIRGFRIELGEIEARLLEHPRVREAVVIARENAASDRRLVAYYTSDAVLEIEPLRAHLGARLPEHMVPAAYVHLDALPLTPNGKVDRKALPTPEGDAYARRGYEAPVGETEAALAEIWSELLGVERAGRWDHFFELGGHSLLAVRVISRVRQVLGAEVGIADLFERPVLADLARAIDSAARTELPPIERVDRGGRLPLSFAQARLWFLEQLGDLGDTYHIPMRLRLGGELDRAALRRTLDAILARHEGLRTTFVEVEGEPVQRIAAESRFHLREHDVGGDADAAAELHRLGADEAGAPFDLEHGPLIRGRLVRMVDDEHILLVTMHHIVSDGWSMGVLTRELGTLYDAFRGGEENPLPPLPIQYADYAAWQRQWVDGEVLREQTAYWKAALTGAPELLELPADHPRPARQSHAGAVAGLELDEAVTAGLRSLGRRHGTTLFMTVLAGWAAVLGRLSGQHDVVVGTPSANRGRAEIEGLIGFFVNTLALRVDLAGSPSVAELLGRVKERALGAQHHQDIPFEQVVELVQPARSLAHTPLFQVMFSWQNALEGGPELPGPGTGGVGSAGAASEVAAKFDLSLSLGEAGGRIVGSLTYVTALFEQATVERYLGYLSAVLRAMAADDTQAVDRLELLPEDERRRVVEEWNHTEADYPRGLCIHQLFEAQVERTPSAVAVVFEDLSLTYAELNARANRLAHHLRERGVGPDARVAVCVERGPEMVVGMLAVLKAGGAYVPLDPAYPPDRLGYMVRDSAPLALLTRAPLAGMAGEILGGLPVPTIHLDAGAEWESRPATNPEVAELTPDHLMYVIYTSGSTGQPKGVMNQHRCVVNRLAWGHEAWGLEVGGAVLQNASFSFDVAAREIFWPLMAGGRVVMPRPEDALDPGYLVETIRRQAVRTACFVPSQLQLFLEHPEAGSCSGLAQVVCSGEALPSIVVRRFRERLPGVALHNVYGPSEAATAVAALRCAADDARTNVPIGRPISNTRVYVLDGAGAPVPVGVTGELYIGGDGVARGYLDRPGLTAERFVCDPFSARAGARLYRTGDLGRWRAEGTIEFLGRNDFQVKIRGFRIEPGEVEARLLEHPGVREAAVLAREDVQGDTRLVAYIVGPGPVEVDALRAHLGAKLPEYMVPAAYVRLDALPLTPNGKLDRKALPAPEGDAYARRGYEAPVGETEQALAEIWSELLGVERVGRWDHFFELGGHSLLAVRVISRVRQVLGAEVAIGDLFERPALADLARTIENAARTELPPIESADRQADLPLSFAQQRLWFIDQLEGAGAAYHMPTSLRLQGELDRAALVRALGRIVARHEALRTTFAETDGDPVQRIAPAEASSFHLMEHDLRGRAQAGAELRRVMAEEAGAPFDLAHGPLIRGRLVRLADDDHVLLITMHHIVSDGWSMGVLTHEISALYAAFRAGEPDPLPPLPVQYADYAAWQRRWVDGDVLRRQAEYWKETLPGAPELLELPTDHARPARQDFAGATAGLVLDEELTAGLKALSERHGTTLFMTVLAGWATVLSRLSGQADVVVGTPSANRGRREIEGLIGFFVNTLALRVELSGAPTVAEVLARVKARALEAQANQDIPFEQVVELVQPARSLGHTPLFQVMFAWRNAPREGLALPGLKLAPAGAASPHVTARFDLLLSLGEAGGWISGGVEYATALFEKETVARWLGYLRRVLEGMAADDAVVIDRLPMLAEAERRLVLREFNDTRREYPREACVHELFEAQAARTPGAVAVVFEGERVTYAALNARANRLAHHLRALGVGPDVRVGICVERSVEMVVGLLGILKAGGAYVPLDASYPVDRLRNMVEDSAPAVLLTHPPLAGTVAELAAGSGVPVLDLTDVAAWADRPAENPDREGLGPRNLAHVLFTSGSTGRPKGVMLEHGSLVNRLQWMQDRYGMTSDEALLQKTPFSFDVSFWEFFWPLMVGARLVMARPGGHRDPAYLVEVIRREGVTVAHFVPSMLPLFLEHPDAALCTGLLRVPVSGEAVSAALARQFHQRLPGVELTNQYGPTESGEVTEWACDPDAERVSIGRAIHNAAVYVLDRTGEPVPVGVAGELFIGGVAVARGYLGRPRLTAERFVPDPFGASGARMYRTGDLCRWLADRTLEYLGRTDFQVKVRGFRVELGEIEARLASHPGVREAVVLALDDGAGGKRLVAYFVGEALESEALKAHLSEQLPEYMVPAAFVRLETFPVTPNGKLDRGALPAPDADAFAARAYEAPLGETERRWRRSGRSCWGSSASAGATTSSSWAGTPSWRCG
jgi:amino acid adenylation domain-containing protein